MVTRGHDAAAPVARVEVRLYGALQDLADVDNSGTTEVPLGQPRSVKDIVESLGIPHTEVGALVVAGDMIGFGHVLTGGERVAVYPDPLGFPVEVPLRPEPPRPVRFVLDVHLGRLARHLRLLGFDTTWGHEDDGVLAEVATSDGRVLVTRDRGLLMRRAVVHGHLARSQDPDEQLEEVVARFGLADDLRPYTRCLRCNGVLAPADRAEVLDRLPPRTRREHDVFAACPDCRQVYWPGSHRPRLDAIVARVANRPSP